MPAVRTENVRSVLFRLVLTGLSTAGEFYTSRLDLTVLLTIVHSVSLVPEFEYPSHLPIVIS